MINIDPGAWAERAACAGLNPDVFFPDRGEPVTESKKVCASCPVSEPCLEYALATSQKFGIWGGKSERERRRIRADRRRGSAA